MPETAPGSAVSSRVWECVLCGYRYDESVGDPDGGIDPGTAWEDIPEDWCCPECGAKKADFDMILLG